MRRAAWFLWITALGAGLVEALLGGRGPLVGVVGAGLDRGVGVFTRVFELGADGLVALAPASRSGRFRFFWLLMFAIA